MKKDKVKKSNKKFIITVTLTAIVILGIFFIILNPDIIPFVNKKEKAGKYIKKASDFLSMQKPGSPQNELLQSKAQVELDAALELEPENQEALLLRASIAITSKRYEEGYGIIDRLIKVNPNFTEAYYYRASGKMQEGDIKEAIKDFSKIIEIDANYIDAYFYRGQLNFLLKDFLNAEKDFTKMIQIKPGIPQGYTSRGLTRLKLGEKDSGCVDLQRGKFLGQPMLPGQPDLDSLMNIECR